MATISQPEGPKKLLQVELPERWLRHIDVEAGKRGVRRRGLLLMALTAFIGEAPDYEAEFRAANKTDDALRRPDVSTDLGIAG